MEEEKLEQEAPQTCEVVAPTQPAAEIEDKKPACEGIPVSSPLFLGGVQNDFWDFTY